MICRKFCFALAFCWAVRVAPIHAAQAGTPPTEYSANYSFLVAGHAFGSHNAANVGLHPDFFARLTAAGAPDYDFLIFTGDTTRDGSPENWATVQKQLVEIERPYYLVMGNHDNTEWGRRLFIEKFGNTFYTFDRGSERFVVLDTQRVYGTISEDQLLFLRKCLGEVDTTIENVLVFFHQVLWTRHPKYKTLKTNRASRYERMSKSNFWEDVYPILQETEQKKIYVFAGDVGARPDSVPAFYDTWGHVTLIASGMGEVNEENGLLVTVQGSSLSFRLIPLDPARELTNLEDFTVENLVDYHDPKRVQLVPLLESYWTRLPRVARDKRFRAGVLLATLFFSLVWLVRIGTAKWRLHGR